MTVPRPTNKRPYHHGDLREALIDVTIELIAERGIQGFTIAEASRRLRVTSAAPYRHFADREQLLAAIAARASELLANALAEQVDTKQPPAERLAAAARTYLHFAAKHRALFQAAYSSGLDKAAHPELAQIAKPVVDAFLQPARELAAEPDELAVAVAATAHGYATLLLDGTWGTSEDSIGTAATWVTTATLALVRGWTAPGKR